VNTASFLAKVARQRPEQVAIRHGDVTETYQEFYERSLALGGNLLARGLRHGDRVAFALANGPAVLETLYGCFAAGLVVVPINARLHPKEMAYIVENSGARAFIHGPEYQDGILQCASEFADLEIRICTGVVDGAADYRELLDGAHRLGGPVDVGPEDASWLFYTSGTTGRPKGATWTHGTIRAMAMNYLADVHNIQGGDVVLHAAPMSHGGGIVGMPAVARGAEQIIVDTASFEPRELFRLIQDHRASHIAFLAPTQIVRMLEDYVPGEFDLSSLKAICYGGAPILVEHLKRALETFGPVFAQIYGQGEAPITITGLSTTAHAELLAAGDERIGSAGTIRTDVEARIVDAEDNELGPGEAGEIVARGDVVMKGYWGNPEATADALRGGWLHTGDIGMFDDRGYLFLLDRAKDMIISGGNNVYPREVEEVIIQHPAVNMVVVLGIPDQYWGEAVHAVIVLEDGQTATAREIIDHCAQHLAGYKKPKAVDFVDELPVSGYGKILRREVRDRYWSDQDGRRIGGGVPSAGRSGNP
jgi:acyl-CoA synthetase (AMP-forming)/AMP-acid ligase II